MKNNIKERHFKLLDKRIKELEEFVETLVGATDLTNVDHEKIKHLIYMIKCQKERCQRFS